MKEEEKIISKVGKENAFSVPDGYFEQFTSDVMSRLPEKEKPAFVQKPTTIWDRMKPWVYMVAMFAGAALIIRTISSSGVITPQHEVVAEEAETEVVSEQYINAAVDNAMLDDYSLYVYLTDANVE